MLYTVYYKKLNGFFWRKLKRVKGDGFIENGYVPGPNNTAIWTTKNIRWFILEDETRIEIPAGDVLFKFSKERHFAIQAQMNKEAGQKIV
jgi:hypothetical protein